MAADTEPIAGSNKVTGTGTNSVTFALPGTPKYLVQSVSVQVNNSAGGDSTGTLTMADTDGTVIAKRRQGEAVTAGATTTATWALRLSGSGATAATATSVGFYDVAALGGNPVPMGTQGAFVSITFAGAGAGVDLLDTSVNGSPSAWVVKTAGYYCFMASINITPSPPAVIPAGNLMSFDFFPGAGADPAPANFFATQARSKLPHDNSFGQAYNTIWIIRYMPTLANGLPYTWRLQMGWSYVGAVNITGTVEAIQLGK